MWVARVKFNGRNALLGNIVMESQVSVCGYIISYHKTEKDIHAFVAGVVFGDEENKNRFFELLRKHPRTVNLERTGDFTIVEIIDKIELSAMYEHKLVHIDPVLIREDGSEYWVIGSWRKKELVDFVELVEGNYGAQLLSLTWKNISNFSMISIQPSLTLKQKGAMELAVSKGYYDYPRKTSIEKLAKIAGLSFATYHAHLRKAEQKLLPHFFDRV